MYATTMRPKTKYPNSKIPEARLQLFSPPYKCDEETQQISGKQIVINQSITHDSHKNSWITDEKESERSY
jgi:hypothetical protein